MNQRTKSITIHNLDPDLDHALANYAYETGLSLNKSIKRLLRKSLGLTGYEARKRELENLFDKVKWTKKDVQEFEKNIADSERIDQSDWE